MKINVRFKIGIKERHENHDINVNNTGVIVGAVSIKLIEYYAIYPLLASHVLRQA